MTSNELERIPFEVDVNRVIEVLANQIYQTPLALLRENAQTLLTQFCFVASLGTSSTPGSS